MNKKTQCKRLVINLHKKDEDIIDRFIEALNLNEEKKEYHGHYITIRFSNKKLDVFGLSMADWPVEKRCKKLGIEKPPRGYWTRFIKKDHATPNRAG